MEPQRKRRNLTQGEFFGSLMYHEPSDPRLICLGKKRKIRFSIQEFILGFCDLMLRFKRLRNDVFFFFFHYFLSIIVEYVAASSVIIVPITGFKLLTAGIYRVI